MFLALKTALLFRDVTKQKNIRIRRMRILILLFIE